ncbi:MAG: tryptophan-rich sensory protein [Ruminococcus sp.]|nr:tryptophan-rich sensory protein [Ruminococcus sp.]
MAISLNWNKIKTYIISILVPVVLGGIVGFFISGFMDYDELIQPVLAPPGWLFPVAWTILYILMGVSYGILKDKMLANSSISGIYYVQLFVNLLWPIIFFVFKWRLLAFIWIVVLDILVIIMTTRFYSKNKVSGLLQLPYVAWILFATYLNLGIYILNG